MLKKSEAIYPAALIHIWEDLARSKWVSAMVTQTAPQFCTAAISSTKPNMLLDSFLKWGKCSVFDKQSWAVYLRMSEY